MNEKTIFLLQKLIFILSGLATTINFFTSHNAFMIFTVFLSFCILCLFSFTKTFKSINNKINITKYKIPIIAVAAIVSWSMATRIYYNQAASNLIQILGIETQILQYFLITLSIPFLTYYLGWFYLIFSKDIYSLLKKQLAFTKKDLYKLATLILAILSIVFIINNITTVFFDPRAANLHPSHQYYGWYLDVIFQTDTDPLFPHYNVFIKDVPSSRQPLFSLFSFPFVAPLYGLSYLLFFLPNIYPTFVISLQISLVFLSTILMYDIVKENLKYPKLFVAFYLSTYSIVIFPLIIERFIFGLFFLILGIYLQHYKAQKNNITVFSSIGAMGTNFLSSLIIFVLAIKCKKTNIKDKMLLFIKQSVVFLSMIIVFGRLPIMFYFGTFEDNTRWLTQEVGFINQIQQFSEFIFASFIFPNTIIDVRLFPRYEQAIVTQFNLTGIAIIVACIYAAIKNRKKFFVKIASFWFSISFILLGVLGWSASQHNMLLFSSFFSFSFVYLFYTYLENILNKFKWQKQIIISIIAMLLLYNLYGLFDLLAFAVRYYSIWG
ncbi:MAG: hypothetical protein FWF50_02900 [Defluviitaleaceae bacterium]|nr:hypothetical protein [Defluviitaleaceae bacterium]